MNKYKYKYKYINIFIIYILLFFKSFRLVSSSSTYLPHKKNCYKNLMQTT